MPPQRSQKQPRSGICQMLNTNGFYNNAAPKHMRKLASQKTHPSNMCIQALSDNIGKSCIVLRNHGQTLNNGP